MTRQPQNGPRKPFEGHSNKYLSFKFDYKKSGSKKHFVFQNGTFRLEK